MPNDTSPTEDYTPDAARIAAQNDAFRRAVTTCPPGIPMPEGLRGRVVFTQAVAARGLPFQLQCLLEIAAITAFEPENDPEGWHDFGAIEVRGERVWFKLDLYSDERMEWGSDRPDDPSLTYRVMTVLFPSDW